MIMPGRRLLLDAVFRNIDMAKGNPKMLLDKL